MRFLRKLLVYSIPILLISCNVQELDEDDCRSCWGRGWYIDCTVCKNTGYCHWCERGWIDCVWCNAGYRWSYGEYVECTYCSKGFYKGKIKCHVCNGFYQDKCMACHGKKEICKDCNGTGKI